MISIENSSCMSAEHMVVFTTNNVYTQLMFERCLYFNSNALVRRINQIWEQSYAITGLSPAHAYTLRLIAQQGGLSQQQIAQQLQLEKSTVTRFVSSLLTKKLVIRKTGSDQREKLLEATKKGAQLAKQLDDIGQQLYQRLLDTLGSEDMTQLVKDLRQTKHKLDSEALIR